MNLGPWEILIIAGVIILLFGARKMPQMARSLGQSMRILKAETKGMRKEEETEESVPAKPQQQLPQAQPKATEAASPVEQPQAKVEQTQANKNAG